jgi:autotransporter-associated beta strand protein
MEFGVILTNNTGAALTTFTLSYTGEQWHDASGATNTLSFGYSTTASDVTGTFTNFSGLNFTGPLSSGGEVAVDGNAPGNNVAISATVTIPGAGWANGTNLLLRWQDTNDPGTDQGLAIDNLSFTASPGAAPKLTWNVPGGSGAWDTSSTNWSGDAVTFSTGDAVTFADGNQGTVTIPSGGVQPSNTTVANTTGTYTIGSSGAIGIAGAGTITKTGAGTLVLTSQNTFSGGTTINAGTLISASPTRSAVGTGPLINIRRS